MTLDAGALIAADRADRRFFVWWKWATRRGIVATVPAPVIAQAWRGARCARLGQVLSGCRTDPLGADVAKRVGELCGTASTSDIVDAFVVLTAAQRGDYVLTSDPGDLGRLASHVPGGCRIIGLDELPGS